MSLIGVLRKLGIFRAGKVRGRYTSGRDMPMELFMDNVYDKQKDTVSKEDIKKVFRVKKGKESEQ